MFTIQTFGLTLLLSIINTQAVDYCRISKCGKSHIACENNGEFSSDCNEPTVVDLSPHLEKILRMHNVRRNIVAAGTEKLLPASRMATMQWDNELAQLALLNVKTCQFAHDTCRTTRKFRYPGQNQELYRFVGRPEKYTDAFLVKMAITEWLREGEKISMRVINKIPQNVKRGPSVGRFTLIIAEKNNHVGCAAVRYKGLESENFLMTCNYATTNIIGRAVYTISNQPGDGCAKGHNPNYPNLCSLAEYYQLK